MLMNSTFIVPNPSGVTTISSILQMRTLKLRSSDWWSNVSQATQLVEWLSGVLTSTPHKPAHLIPRPCPSTTEHTEHVGGERIHVYKQPSDMAPLLVPKKIRLYLVNSAS